MAQISASIPKTLIEEIRVIQARDGQPSFSQMVENLLREAVETRKKKYKK